MKKYRGTIDYLQFFTPQNLALLSDWLEETGELLVDVYLPHSGSGGTQYLVRSMQDLKSLVAQQTHPEIIVSIFRHMQYPLRGIANDELLQQVLQEIEDGQWYHIVSLDDYFPSPCSIMGNGDSHKELREEFSDLTGEKIGIGRNPFDYYDHKWAFANPNVLVLWVSGTISRNQNFYKPHSENPERYRTIVEMWGR